MVNNKCIKGGVPLRVGGHDCLTGSRRLCNTLRSLLQPLRQQPLSPKAFAAPTPDLDHLQQLAPVLLQRGNKYGQCMSAPARHTSWAVGVGAASGGAAAVQPCLMDLWFKPPSQAPRRPPSHLHRRLPRAHGQALLHEGLQLFQ